MDPSIEVVEEIPVDRYRELGLTDEKLRWMLRKMLEARRFEEMVERLFLVEGKLIGPAHLYLGEEAVAAGVIGALREDDVIVTTYRGHGHAIARGVSMKALMAELFGKVTGTCRGLSGSMHSALSVEHNIPMATAIVGSGIPIACGVGLALKYRREDRIAVVFFGDGAANTGAFNEGVNLAAVWKLPILFVCENNQYALSVPHRKSFAGESIAARGACYGMRSFLVEDGNDVIAVYYAANKAGEYIRSGNGPAFIECRTYRKKGHGVYDTAWYRPKDEVEFWMKRDPIDRFFKKLKSLGIISEDEFRRWDEEIASTLEEAVKEAEEASVMPFDELWDYLYVSGGARYGEWR